MYVDVIAATYAGDYKLYVTFADGKAGVVDFAGYIQKGGVFERLKDIEYFKKFEINQELGVITWNNEVDIAPETLYSKALETPLPGWMRPEKELEGPAS
ncbi:MAG: DUF2442 domain-containing protein [Deltaproteobacteria bacterium]|nr:MAG: DUF2442 domain-containing protein [Deltaproteobacteria bacterium]